MTDMKIAICASISAREDILRVKEELESLGHVVGVPEDIENWESVNRRLLDMNVFERANDKIENDFIRKHYEVIKRHDAILVVNSDKNGIKGYIGGNTFLEMGFAFILNKKIFCLNQLPELPYASEIIGMQPIVLNGNLNLLG